MGHSSIAITICMATLFRGGNRQAVDRLDERGDAALEMGSDLQPPRNREGKLIGKILLTR
jgi:hypothetical protein